MKHYMKLIIFLILSTIFIANGFSRHRIVIMTDFPPADVIPGGLGFGPADKLRSVTWQGNSGTWGRPASEIIGQGRDNEASEKTIDLLEQEDQRPIWFSIWGGSCDLAQALWKIRETLTLAEANELLKKIPYT